MLTIFSAFLENVSYLTNRSPQTIEEVTFSTLTTLLAVDDGSYLKLFTL